MTMLRLLAIMCLAPSLALAQARLPPVSDRTQITPNGASQPSSLGQLLSGTRFAAPRGHIRAWMPWTGNPQYDTGTTCWTGSQSKTVALPIEIPSDATAAQVIFANGSPSSTYTIANASIAGSSQLAVPGYTGNTPGITPYNDTGSALSAMTLLSFGNNGVDSQPPLGFQTSPPLLNAPSGGLTTTAATAATAANATGLTFAANSTCPALGLTALIVGNGTSTGHLLLYPGTTVSACNSTAGTITLSAGARSAVP